MLALKVLFAIINLYRVGANKLEKEKMKEFTKVAFIINSAQVHVDLHVKALSFDEKLELTGCEIESENDLKLYTFILGGMYHSIDALCLSDAIEWFESEIKNGDI